LGKGSLAVGERVEVYRLPKVSEDSTSFSWVGIDETFSHCNARQRSCSCHSKDNGKDELEANLSYFLSPNSPDLNPIEAVWDMIKYYIQQIYYSVGGGKRRSQNSLRKIIKEAWDFVSPGDLVRFLESMPSIYKAMKDLEYGLTKYCDKNDNERLNNTQGYE
ncbi:hypothetical protein GcM3_194030, partial [Golovinomyces cichoracearum]